MKKCSTLLLMFALTCASMAQNVLEFEPFASGLAVPVDVVNAGGDMLYVVEKAGTIKRIEANGNVIPTNFLDIRDRVNNVAGEQGLLGMVFHPKYPDTAHFYVNYTDDNGRTVIARYSVDPSDMTQAIKSSEQIILTIDQPFTNHNGGDVVFGPDGYLYIPTGDGGSGNDPRRNGQNLNTLLAKMLRIDVDGGRPYAIPADNPFVGDPDALDEIWAYGLRNPWRVDFDPANGDLFIADVGQNAFEEIDYQRASSTGGENYGWRCYEANVENNTNGCDLSGFTFPIYDYPHNSGFGCRASISGGVVYRGTEFPALNGKYIFGDYCSGYVGVLYQDAAMTWQHDTVAQYAEFAVTSFGRDMNGEVYMVDIGAGEILKVVDKSTAVIDVDKNAQLTVSNPVEATLELRNEINFNRGHLVNSQGRINLSFTNQSRLIDVSSLAPGIYMLSLQVDNKIQNQKIIIL